VVHEFSGKVDWADLTEWYDSQNNIEPITGFVVQRTDHQPTNKDDLIMNKLWDLLHANMGKEIRITFQVDE